MGLFDSSKLTNAVKAVTKDISDISTSTITRNYTSVYQNNILNLGPGCEVSGRIMQSGLVTVDVKAMQSADNLNTLDAELTDDIAQKAEATRQALSLSVGGNNEIINDTELWKEMYTEMANDTLMECFANIVQENTINMGADCKVTGVIEQKLVGSLTSNCVNEAVNKNEKMARFINSVKQDATMTEEGILSGLFGGPLVMIAIVVAVVVVFYLFMKKNSD